LAKATKDCKSKAQYGKGEHSFKLLGKIDPAKATAACPWASGLLSKLEKKIETYRTHTGRRPREFRLEVLRAGFKAAWSQKDLQTIINVAGKIPEVALQEDKKLPLWYAQALTLSETGG